MKNNHKCTCSIVPPYIMDQFKDEFKNTIETTQAIVKARKDISMQIMGPSLGTGPLGKADRIIYDSQNTSKDSFRKIREEGDPPSSDKAANSVYDNAGFVRDFYKNTFNYFSVDNRGKDLCMNIHFQEDFNNALWSSASDAMFFGDGDGQTLINLTGAIDVIGHEMTHGVIEYTAGLIYQGQSGALNEHLADVFGTMIKQKFKGENAWNADWLIGDTVVGPKFQPQTGFQSVSLRSLAYPGCAYLGDFQPANMDRYFTGSDDNFGVHINSGILNKVFYLVSTGQGMGIPGMDTTPAGQLWFNSLKAISTDTCDFNGFKNLVIKNAEKQVLEKSLQEGTVELVGKAFSSVGL